MQSNGTHHPPRAGGLFQDAWPREGKGILGHVRGTIMAFLALSAISLVTWAEPPVDRLPEWFEGHRVQLHSEQNIDVILRLTPEGLAKADRSLGASVATHLLVTLGEGACWPTKVGKNNPFTGTRDFAAEMIGIFHKQGLKLVGYYRHMCDQAMQEEHPDWICRHPDGKPVHEVRTKTLPIHVLCMNSPYREYTKTRLMELADRGLDVVYFDSWHMSDICACEYCRKAFRQELGHEMDPKAAGGHARVYGGDPVCESHDGEDVHGVASGSASAETGYVLCRGEFALPDVLLAAYRRASAGDFGHGQDGVRQAVRRTAGTSRARSGLRDASIRRPIGPGVVAGAGLLRWSATVHVDSMADQREDRHLLGGSRGGLRLHRLGADADPQSRR